MNQQFQLILIAIALISVLGSFITTKKISIWKVLILVMTGGLYALLHINHSLVIPHEINIILVDYYPYYLLFIVSLFLITLRRKIRITQNLTDYDFFEMEKELEEIKSTSELLRLRFIQTIDLLHEGLLFYSEDLTSVFLTEQAASLFQLTNHDITLTQYMELIHSEDRSAYQQALKKMTKKHPSFELKYRIKRDQTFVWVEEKIRLFEFNKVDYLISSIQGIEMKLFPITLIHELDSLPNENHLIQNLSQIIKEPEVFYLVMIQLTNIVDLNQRFGRDVGNLMIAEYIKKIRFHFAKDINSIFRVTGIQFALVIKEQRKYDVLLRALQSGGDLVNLQLSIGGINQMVYPNLGIVKREPWASYGVSELISLGNKALEEAIRNPKKNYAVFGE